MANKKTIAQTIAARYGNDGVVWTDASGIDFADACDEHANPTLDGDPRMCDTNRLYIFADDSQIVITPQGWTDSPQAEDLMSFAEAEG